jgi:hypothetical protein
LLIPQIGNRFISEFHKDIVKAVAALPTPSAALAGFRRWRTSDNIEYYCDGTRWLSSQLHRLEAHAMPGVASSLAANTTGVLWQVHPNNTNDLYVTAITTTVFVQTTNSSVSYWQVKVRTRVAGTTDAATSFIADTSAAAPGVLIPLSNFVTSPGSAALPQIITRTNFYDLRVDYTKAGSTGTPGTMFYEPLTVWYRLIG